MNTDVFIFNYGHFQSAIRLYEVFQQMNYETYLLNCKGPLDPEFESTDHIIKLDNVYYSGQWNEALRRSNADVLFLINSDVSIRKPQYLMKRLELFYDYFGEQAGIYGPNHYWTPWTYNIDLLETIEHNFKKVPATDSTLWAVRRSIAQEVGEIDVKVNSLGWGIEVVSAYYCFLKGMYVVRDYNVKCVHPQSTTYNRHNADLQWRQWVHNKGLGKEFWDYYHSRDKYGFGCQVEYSPNLGFKRL